MVLPPKDPADPKGGDPGGGVARGIVYILIKGELRGFLLVLMGSILSSFYLYYYYPLRFPFIYTVSIVGALTIF